MTQKRFAVAVISMGLGLLLLFFVLMACRTPRTRTGSLTVTFAGLTNDVSGVKLAQFNVANTFSSRVRCGIGDVQFRDTNGWQDWMRVAGGDSWLAVSAGSNQVFSVPVPAAKGATWRVPLSYQEDPPVVDEVLDRIKGIAYGIAHWRPGRPSFRIASRRYSFAYGPEMVGLSPQLMETEFSHSTQDTNRVAPAAGSSH